MAYVVNNTRGQIIAVVADGTVNTTATSQTLVGKNVTPYGEYEVENLVHQLENFANSTAPGNPIEGQLWYDTTNSSMQVYTGTSWKALSGVTTSTSAPVASLEQGDLWYNPSTQQLRVYGTINTGVGWAPVTLAPVSSSAPTGTNSGQMYFNSTTNQLFVWNGTVWSLVGPEGVAGFATTRWTSTSLPDQSLVQHAVITASVDGNVVAIASNDAFTILPGSAPTGFTSLVSGINLASGSVINGRSTQADSLTTARTINGIPFDGTANITIVNAGDLLPGAYITGSPYSGSVPQTWGVNATDAGTGNTVVARNSIGDFSARVITATIDGNITGTATNVTGVVAGANGGTGHNAYAEGQILIGAGGSTLNRGNITGNSPISVTSTSTGISIDYVGGTGTGNVSSVGIVPGNDGINVTGSPITGAGNITVTNTGVIKLNAGNGISVNTTIGNVTVTNSGVTSLTNGGGIGLSSDTGGVTISNNGVTRIIAGSGVAINPTNGLGEVTISSTGGGGGGGVGTVFQVATGAGLTGGPITGAGTIAVDASVMRSNVAQTVSAVKTFTGGIVSQAYNFTSTGNSIFWAGPATGSQLNQVQIAVNNAAPHYFFQTKMVVQGNADQLISGDTYAGAIVGVDGGFGGGAGVMGWHTGAEPGIGVGTSARASNMSFTGAVFQGSTNRAKSESFIQIRSYSGNDPVFQVTGGGNVTADGTYTSPAADYAEYFEWADGNPNNEDRVGSTVALEGNQIRQARNGDVIIGVVSATPAMVGDAAELNWNNKYLQDEFGRELREEYFHWDWKDDQGQTHSVASYEDTSEVPDHAVKKTTDGHGNLLTCPVLNPAYDPSITYTPRSQRKEWAPVGLVGKLRVRTGQPTAPTWIKLRDISQNVEEWLVK